MIRIAATDKYTDVCPQTVYVQGPMKNIMNGANDHEEDRRHEEEKEEETEEADVLARAEHTVLAILQCHVLSRACCQPNVA